MARQMTSEIELLQASLNGSSEAFEAIVRKYQSLICAITYSATGDLDKSEELAQQAFVNAWKNLAQLRDLASFRTWLCSIARSIIRNYFRSQERDIISHAAPIEKVAPELSDHFEPAEIAINREQQAVMREALRQIPDNYREPLVLYYREQKSLKQVAEQLMLSEGAARQRISRGRAMLKEQVAAMVETTLSRNGPTAAFTAAVVASIGAMAVKTSAAATASTTGVTGTGAAVTAAASGLTAKIVTLAAVLTIGAAAVITYNRMTSQTKKPTPADTLPTLAQPDTSAHPDRIDTRTNIIPDDTSTGSRTATAPEPPPPPHNADSDPTPPPPPAETETKEFVFEPKGVLSGLITDAETYQPIEGVEVRISGHTATSDANGMYYFAGIENDGPYSITLQTNEYITPEEWKGPRESVLLRKNAQIVKHFELVRGCKINIKAIDEQANPVKGVGFFAAYTADEMGRGPKDKMRTDEQGSAVLGGLRPAEYLIIAFHNHFALAGQRIVLTDPNRVESLEFQMRKGIEVEGLALCSDGLPASGWQVQAEPAWFHCTRHKLGQKISGEGQFTLPHIISGIHLVSISIPHEDGSSGLWSTDVNLPPESGLLELNIPKPSPHARVSISGTIEFLGSEAGCSMWIHARDQNRNFGSTFLKKGRKNFKIDNLVPGLYTIDFSIMTGDAERREFRNIQAPSEGLVFEIPLVKTGRLHGRVVDKNTGRPVTNFQVAILGQEDLLHVTDPNGAFQLSATANKAHKVQITAEGFAPRTSAPITPDTNEPVVIELGIAAAIEGTVVDEAGKPIMGATINHRYARSRDESPEAKYITATDANGAFVLDDVPQDSHWRWFVIRHPNYAPEIRLIDVEEDYVTDVEIVLKKGGAIEGYVYDEQGRPVPDVTLCFIDKSQYSYWKENRARLVSVVTDNNGFYHITALPEKLCFGFKQEPDQQLGTVCAGVVPINGWTLRLDFGGESAATGRLLQHGLPLADTKLAIMGNTAGYETAFTAYALTDPNGRFTFYGIPTGRRFLYYEIPGMTGFQRWAEMDRFEFEAGVSADLGDFDAHLADVTINLTGEDPAHPIAEWQIYVQKYNPELGSPWAGKVGRLAERSQTRDPYTFSNIPPGDYEAVANCQGQRWIHKHFQVEQGHESYSLSLRIPSGSAALAGTVKFPQSDDGPPEMTLRAPDHDLAVFVKPAPDGSFRVENLPAGRYLVARGHSRTAMLSEITLSAGQSKTVDIDLSGDREQRSDGYMVVVVVAEDGQPLAGADVWLEKPGRLINPHFDTDVGKSLQGEPGEYALHVQYPAYTPVKQQVNMKSRKEFNTQQILDPVVITMSKQ
ncbi:MAG TPA: sigma-70 family RNA polymerase sigma factor [Sedimentisphaerales bacterium]|nr:sigma-70 family RNA polymerase sigma factor [Sedimentisphaerales bacterium]